MWDFAANDLDDSNRNGEFRGQASWKINCHSAISVEQEVNRRAVDNVRRHALQQLGGLEALRIQALQCK